MNIAILIPARFKSTRFEAKLLADILGKPMIQRVYEGVKHSLYASFVAILTDDKRIVEKAQSFGADVFDVRGEFKTGTDRIASFVKDKDFDYIVNVQGDEPLIDSQTVDKLIRCAVETKEKMATLIAKCEEHSVEDSNTVKVVVDKDGYALYFSRAKIPYERNAFDGYFKHIGIYIYSKETLLKLSGLPQSGLERAEGLEQLRALENGIRIKTCITDKTLMGVDTPEDLKAVIRYMSSGVK